MLLTWHSNEDADLEGDEGDGTITASLSFRSGQKNTAQNVPANNRAAKASTLAAAN
jgi:hypothetical protein